VPADSPERRPHQATYDPTTYEPLTFHDAQARFGSGGDDPVSYLERCLAQIDAREGELKGWVSLRVDAALDEARQSRERYRQGKPLSRIDGMPIGIKDLLETKDLPTEMGSPAFKGNFPKRDTAVVRALREAGAIILGKTVTTALGFLDPGPTTNAFDVERTPGGSSSGSGAVVGARMVPVAIGTQLVGSVIRPASFNANWALKPTFGAINRGERQNYSQSHIGVHAGSATDMWRTAMEIVQRVGGDPGQPGLLGPADCPAASKPRRLGFFESAGWAGLDQASREAMEGLLAALESQGVEIVRRAKLPELEAFEEAIFNAKRDSFDIISWEQRWSLQNLSEQHPEKLGPSLREQLRLGRSMTLPRYRELLEVRDAAKRSLLKLDGQFDALITLASSGPAPRIADIAASDEPTGDLTFSCVSSFLRAPSVTAPVLAVDGMPVGIQVMGQPGQDERCTAVALWIAKALLGERKT
jgi:Asp-tRNA(Asn)/Glu-tRNA(Gln) amidotransferase A subunit family amidase